MKSIKEQVEYLRDFVVDEKNALFDRLIQERTDYVTVVLEDLFQSHNQSAVMRSADCYGIQHVHLIENRNSYDMTSTVSQGARIGCLFTGIKNWKTIPRLRSIS